MGKRKYPILFFLMLLIGVLEVSSQYATANTVVFSPTDDTMINQVDNPNTVFGDSSSIMIRNKNGGEIDSLLQFDIFSIPSTSTIVSASLNLYLYDWSDSNAAGRSLSLYQITSSWKEETVRWNTQPTYALVPSSSSVIPASKGRWMAWDVKDDVQTIIQERVNFGWKITDEDLGELVQSPTISFRTKEYGNYIPYLEVAYTVPEPNQAPVASFSITPSNPTTEDSIQFTDHSVDSDGTIAAWYWSFGDGNSSTNRDPTHTYTQSGQYTVTVQVTNNLGQTTTMTSFLSISKSKSTPGFEWLIAAGAIAIALFLKRNGKKRS